MKAIEMLRTLKNAKYVDDFVDKSDNTILIRITQKASEWVSLDEAMAELEQLQTKLQSLEQYCEEQIIELEDSGWYESTDKEQALEAVYKILEKLRS